MARINLLPWRDELRQEKKKEFFTVLVGFGILGVLCGYVWISSVQGAIDDQQSRNKRLENEIAALEEQVKEIQELKQRKAELLDRMEVIQDLQYTRPVIVHYFDELVRVVPEGVSLITLSREGDNFSITGMAESYNRISSLLRNLEGSEWFDEANMSTIDEQEDVDLGTAVQQFSMTVRASTPDKEEDQGASS